MASVSLWPRVWQFLHSRNHEEDCDQAEVGEDVLEAPLFVNLCRVAVERVVHKKGLNEGHHDECESELSLTQDHKKS